MNDDYQLLAAEGGSRTSRQKALLVARVALVALGVLLFLALLWLRTWPPLNVVMSGSMEPTIKTGDVVVMKRLGRPAQVGDIVAVHPPQEIQQRLNYPDTIIHRIVKIGPDGKVFTEGDARNQRDPFTVPLDAVQSHVVATIPSAGQIVAFFTGPLGLIWLGIGLLLFVLLPYLELRRDQVELEQAELGSLAMMRMELREISNRVEGEYDQAEAPAEQVPSELRTELDEMRGTMGELVAAVGEYGEHLRSHTAVLQGMSAASQDLAETVAALRGVLPTTGLTAPAQPVPPPTQTTPPAPAQPAPPSQAQPIARPVPPSPAAQPQPTPPPPQLPAAQPQPPTANAEQLRREAEAFIRWQEQRAIEIAISMGFRDPLGAARLAPLDDAADDESIERTLWELAFENPHLLVV